ncbi:hypothetical protein ACP70R_049266 [Stipagrostis hirtigluma subsp. patula]
MKALLLRPLRRPHGSRPRPPWKPLSAAPSDRIWRPRRALPRPSSSAAAPSIDELLRGPLHRRAPPRPPPPTSFSMAVELFPRPSSTSAPSSSSVAPKLVLPALLWASPDGREIDSRRRAAGEIRPTSTPTAMEKLV